MRIGLTYDLKTDASSPVQADYDAPATVAAITQALRRAGHAVVPLGSSDALLRVLATHARGLDLVFNLAEGRTGRCRESWVPAVLETAGVPYTGSGPAALALALDKLAAKRLCQAEGIPTPPWTHVLPGAPLRLSPSLHFPLIVKPRHEGSAMGIDAGAVAHDRATLEARVRWLASVYHEPVLIEEFITGREATVCVIGNDPPEPLPVILRLLDSATGLAWHVGDASRRDPVRAVVPAALTPTLESALQRQTVAVFTLLGCRDVARVDFRISDGGRPYFLEINPLPNLAPDDSFGLLGESLGIGYDGMIGRILEAALARLRRAAVHPPPVLS